MDKTTNKFFVLKLALILFTITFIATLLLTFCNYITKDRIAMINEENAQKAKQEVIANAEFEKVTLSDEITKQLIKTYSFVSIDKALINGELAGYCVNLAPQGFGGSINMIVGIDTEMKYTGIKIVSMSETPGLGAKIQNPDFYEQFSDNKNGMLSVVKNKADLTENEIQAISGATISSKAVTNGANSAMEIVKLIVKTNY